MELCGQTLAFGDDLADNVCTFACKLPAGHKGPHVEVGVMYRFHHYVVSWVSVPTNAEEDDELELELEEPDGRSDTPSPA